MFCEFDLKLFLFSLSLKNLGILEKLVRFVKENVWLTVIFCNNEDETNIEVGGLILTLGKYEFLKVQD